MKRFAFLNPKIFLLAFMATSAFSLATPAAQAQSVPSQSGGLSVSSSISNPTPGQSVTLTAESYTVDLGAAAISWSAGGKVLGKAVGLNSITVTAPDAGKRLTVTVTAISPGGISLVSSIVIASGAVDMIIEPQGYVPPFFAGKASIAYQNTIKVIAIPHLSNSSGAEYDPQTLVYKWEQGSNVLQDQSGYAKQAVTIPGTLVPRPYIVTVTVSTRDGSAMASGAIEIAMAAPSLSFYRNDPLYGPFFNLAIDSTLFLGTQREAGILAVPYGFNAPTSGIGDLSFTWLINGIKHSELSSSKSIVTRAPDAGSGSSNISLTVSNAVDILQQADANLSVTWSAANSGSSQAVSF